MNSPSVFRKLRNAWSQASRRKKLLAGCIILLCIFSGWFTLYLANPWLESQDDPYIPILATGLDITEEVVYSNGTVSFVVICHVSASSKNYPIPEGDIYHIKRAFICVEDRLLEFNATLGEIKTTSEVTVIEGDFSLSAHEEVSLTFQTTFDLHNLSHIYIGVLAARSENPNTAISRWDRYTSIIHLMTSQESMALLNYTRIQRRILYL